MRIRPIALLLLAFTAGPAAAQVPSSCQDAVPPSVGVAVGKSSPYFDLARGVVEAGPGSVLVESGAELTGRADVSPAGIFRLRVDASTERWAVRRKVYDPAAGYQEVADMSE